MDWIQFGYLGMFLSSILAATILPFGSEIVFSSLLYLDYDVVFLILVAGTGNTIGGMISMYMGRLGKWDWIEKWLKISHNSVLKYMEMAQKWGAAFAFFTWLPVIGDIMAVVIGFTKYAPIKALPWMFIGKTLRFVGLAYLWSLQDII